MTRLRLVAAIAAALSIAASAQAQELRKSIFDGDLAAVRAALARKVMVNATEPQGGWTALMNAVAYAKGPRVEIVRLLLDAGAALEAVNDQGETPLIVATKYPRLNGDVVRLLIERGANVNARSKKGRTALMHAAYELEVDEVIVLVEKGADVNAADAVGDTALLIALSTAGVPPDASDAFPQNREALILKTIEPLLEHGANPNVKNKAGESAMMHVQRWEAMTAGLPAIGVRLKQAGAR